MKKIYWFILIITIVLVTAAAWYIKDIRQINKELPETEQKEENALQMSVVSISQTDNFYNIQVEYPQFKNLNEEFNQKISSLITSKIDDFKKNGLDNWNARKATAEPGEEIPKNPEQPFDFISTWEVAQFNNSYIGFVIRIYYYVGGAHGANEVYAFNYDVVQEKEITLFDFLNNSQESFEKVADLCKQEVTAQLQSEIIQLDDFLRQMIESGTKPAEENYRNFSFKYNSLTIYFQQYQVAPGAMGEVTVTFYKSTLNANSINSKYLK
jgi:hypothetical protein